MLYKFFGADTAQETLRILKYVCDDHTLRASDPRTFNDPFEFKVDLDLNADEADRRVCYFKDNPGKTEDDFATWQRSLTPQNKWYIATETRNEFLSRLGVICFSESFDNHLMWSHYAKNHTGFCVGFDASILESIPETVAHGAVAYAKVPPAFRYFYEGGKEFVRKAFFFKTDCWAYEQEVRIVLKKQGKPQFPPKMLREVILGCKASDELRQYAHENLEKMPGIFFEMTESFGAYTTTRSPINKERI